MPGVCWSRQFCALISGVKLWTVSCYSRKAFNDKSQTHLTKQKSSVSIPGWKLAAEIQDGLLACCLLFKELLKSRGNVLKDDEKSMEFRL